MGFLSGLNADKLLRAAAIMQGNYGDAAQITDALQQQKKSEAAAAQKAAERQQVYESLVKLTGDPDKALVMLQNLEASGKAQADIYSQQQQPRQFGPEGGSMAAPDAQGNYSTTYTAPAWQNGTLFGATSNGNTAPPILREGEKAIPVEAGGSVAGQMPYSGTVRPIVQQNTGQGGFGDTTAPRIQSADDYNKLAPGASYYDPQGNLRKKPGGGGGNATGNFRNLERYYGGQ